jgi:hypothetical protein
MDGLPGTKATRVAIEFLTLWMEPSTEARKRAAAHITEVMNEEETFSVIAGLLNLNLLSLFHLAEERGADESNMVERARGILQEWSPQLPE